MSNEKSSSGQHDFSTLSGIMEHFFRVPFDQFQQELNEWFYKSLNEKGIDPCKLNETDTTGFPEQLKEFVENIYSQAEILQKKQDNK
jgi:hypothetical protein